MIWFYFFGIAVLVGAEVNSEIEKAAGTVAASPPEIPTVMAGES
jgi:uncharacterized BrkB/YihY/UPF0761 family membrane protein